jgi:hypothetical protein
MAELRVFFQEKKMRVLANHPFFPEAQIPALLANMLPPPRLRVGLTSLATNADKEKQPQK